MQYLAADAIFNGDTFLESNKIIAVNENGLFHGVLDEQAIQQGKIQKLNGIITPGFINAHCHTELSHLANMIPQKTGLPAFGKQIVTLRNSVEKKKIQECIISADLEMQQNGVVAVGDICNTADSFEMKTQSSVYYHSFIELLGLDPERAAASYNDGLSLLQILKKENLAGSLAPHAPYSTSKDLIFKIAAYNQQHNLSSSIHNQESEEETKFFNGLCSGFHDLYDFLKLDISWFKAPMTSSLAYYNDALLHQKTILVHNTFTKAEDIELVKNKNVYWCFCPRANNYIENKLPSFDLFLDEASRICLGTDSLASNTGLSLVAEANYLLQNSSFSVEEVLRMMTSNAANALGIQDKFGKLIPGADTGLNLVEVKEKELKLVKKLNPVSL